MKKVYSLLNSFSCAFLTSEVHFNATVEKKEEEQWFSVDIEAKYPLHANFISMRGLKDSVLDY